MEKYFTAAMFLAFTFGAWHIAFGEFTWLLWALTASTALLTVFFAAQVAPKVYTWMCAYSFQGGTGRMFITAGNKTLSKSFVTAIDAHIAKDKTITNPFVYSIQFMGESVTSKE